jgi:membrane associated rhomboid family serine protease
MRYDDGYRGRPYGGTRIGPGRISPFIKYMLIANGAIFILQYVAPELTYYLGLTPRLFFADFPNALFQPLTYMFLHGGFFHLLFNMFALWMFGTEIELTWGSRRFGRFYVLAGLSGAILTLIVNPSLTNVVIGASAAIYAVLVAYWIMFPNRLLYLYFLFPIKVKWAIPGFMVLGFLFGGANIAHWAHLGGALFGLVYVKADWRWAAFGNRLKSWRYRRREAKLSKNRERAEDVMKRVDAILDKINRVGIDNLTKAERKFLEEASSELSRENGKE